MKLREFLERHVDRPPEPDGRPLYAYRCTREEWHAILAGLRARLSSLPSTRISPDEAAMICLAGAEWWRRRHEHGAWSWDGLKCSIGKEQWNWSTLVAVIRTGLERWDRPVLSRNGRQLYLVTIACEGGMPLKLLQQEGSKLHAYFRAIMEDFRVYGYGGTESSEELFQVAADRAHLLPVSLRSEETEALAADLVAQVWSLRSRYPLDDKQDPVAWLDLHDPAWRDTMPILLENDTALAFLRGLVSTASDVARGAKDRIRMATWLVERNGKWHLERRLSAARRIEPAVLESFLGTKLDPGSRRLGLRMYSPEHSEVAAYGRLLRRHEQGNPYWILTTTGARGLVLEETGEILLEISSGSEVLAKVAGLEGASALPDLPWTFRQDTQAPGAWELLATGSCKVRSEEVLVLAGADWSPKTYQGVGASFMGAPLDRTAYRVQGDVTFHRNGDQVRVRTAAEAEEGEYSFSGARLDLPDTSSTLWLGLPDLYRTLSSARRAPVNTQRIRVRHPDGSWRPWDETLFGTLRFRLYGEREEVAWENRLTVLPPDFRWTMTVGDRERDGAITLSSRFLRRVGLVRAAEGVYISRTNEGHTVHVPCVAPHLPHLHLRLDFGTEVDLCLPWPVERASFESAKSDPLPHDHPIHISRLGRHRLRIITPSTTGRYYLSASSSDLSTRLETTQPVPRVREGFHELPLRHVLPAVERLLAMSDTYDTDVRLQVFEVGSTPGQGTSIRVRRYDWVLQRDTSRGEVVLTGATGQPLDEVTVEARPLKNVSKTETLPFIGHDAAGTPRWRFAPESREPGTWLITARDGAWHRGRTLAWTVDEPPGRVSQTLDRVDSALVAAMEQHPARTRWDHIALALRSLAANPRDEDWRVVTGFLEVAADIPPATFDVLRCMSYMPDVVAMAAVRSMHEPDFEAIWDLFERFPFMWELVPLGAWENAFEQYHRSCLPAMHARDAGMATLVERTLTHGVKRVENLLPTVTIPFCRWAEQEGIQHSPCRKNEVLSARGVGPVEPIYDSLRDTVRELRERHASDQWPCCPAGPVFTTLKTEAIHGPLGKSPLSPFTDKNLVPGYTRPVVFAPAAAASAAVSGTRLERRVIFFLREFKEFDPEYFETAYQLALILLARERWKSPWPAFQEKLPPFPSETPWENEPSPFKPASAARAGAGPVAVHKRTRRKKSYPSGSAAD